MQIIAPIPRTERRLKQKTFHKTKDKKSLFKILCKCLFSEVTVQAVTKLDNKAAHCHSPVLQRHRPFLGRRLDCQPHRR
nr:RecName: Full=Protein PerD [Escherichia coli O127:H6 str. E2348/69]CAA88448.1 PerD [Escherichia coli]